MFSWLAKKVVSHNMARLRAGDPGPTLRMDAKDVRMVFPGDSSWAVDLHGKDEHARWLQRFVSVGIQIFPDEVIVKGAPWNQTVCVRGHDHVRSADGELIYDNRYVLWGRMGWGLLKEYEVYEDTVKTKAFDERLGTPERAVPVS